MLYLTCTTITSVDLAHYGVSRAQDWVSVDCGTICNIEEPQQEHCLGTVSYRLLVKAGGLKLVLLDSNPRFLLLQEFLTFVSHE